MSKSYRFGQFVLDPGRRTLARADSPVSLTPKAFDVLLFLTQNPNRLITKEELLQAVWGDTFVEEGSLAQYVWHLRKALGDNPEGTRLIVTIARKGYQFTENVTVGEAEDTARQAAGQAPAAQRLRTDTPPDSGVPKIEAVTNTSKAPRKDVVRAPAIFLWALATAVLVAVGALGVWRYELYRHRITLAPTDTIVLADADNRTGDPVFDDALTTALRYEMAQTPYLNLLGLDKTYSTIRQLGLPPTTKITTEIARQICSKTSSKMVISDSIADAGNQYHLEIRALDCESGATLAEETTNIGSRNQVVHELGATAARLRRKLGEPAESLGRFNQPLEKATSASLEALQTGALGTKLFLAGNPQAALPFYQRGIELDPDLALTYEGIGAANGTLAHSDLEKAAYTRAYQLRDRLTEKDRLNIDYLHYSDVTGELDKAYSVLLGALKLFPRDVFFHHNLAYTSGRLGQPNRAADLEDETARLEPSTLYFTWAVWGNISASRFNQAKSWLAQAKASKFDSLQLSVQEYRLAFIEGDQRALDQIFEDETHGPNRAAFLRERAKLEAPQGRLDSADRLLREASRLSPDADQNSMALVFSALQDAEAGKVFEARNTEDQGLQRKLDRDRRMVLALALARSGRTEEAARLADEVSQEAPVDTTVQKYLVPTVRAAIQLHKHDPAAAIDLLRGTVNYDLAYTDSFYFLYPAYIRGLAYLELGDGRSASGEFQKLIQNPGLCWGFTGPLARLQLARAERLMGDNGTARKFYQEFLTMWKGADPDLPIYRQGKAEYAKLQKL
jgi:DNA-binding winged helix-turn-helix (wHTH) protein/tetratricopeptide (TPR) repeat protein